MKTRKTLEDQKQALKEKINKEIDGYYEKFQQIRSNGKLNIDTIEQIMIKNKEEMQALINEATSEIVETGQEGVKKKSVPDVKEH